MTDDFGGVGQDVAGVSAVKTWIWRKTDYVFYHHRFVECGVHFQWMRTDFALEKEYVQARSIFFLFLSKIDL